MKQKMERGAETIKGLKLKKMHGLLGAHAQQEGALPTWSLFARMCCAKKIPSANFDVMFGVDLKSVEFEWGER